MVRNFVKQRTSLSRLKTPIDSFFAILLIWINRIRSLLASLLRRFRILGRSASLPSRKASRLLVPMWNLRLWGRSLAVLRRSLRKRDTTLKKNRRRRSRPTCQNSCRKRTQWSSPYPRTTTRPTVQARRRPASQTQPPRKKPSPRNATKQPKASPNKIKLQHPSPQPISSKQRK